MPGGIAHQGYLQAGRFLADEAESGIQLITDQGRRVRRRLQQLSLAGGFAEETLRLAMGFLGSTDRAAGASSSGIRRDHGGPGI
jgi:hypothetical protein